MPSKQWDVGYTEKVTDEQLPEVKENPLWDKRLKQIVAHIRENPFAPGFDYEVLRYDYAGYHSRRLTKKHRVIYRVEGNSVTIVQVLGHYRDR